MAARKSIRCAVQHEIAKRKGSRFISAAWPLAGGNAASEMVKQFVETQRNKFPTANHHCYACLTMDGRALCSDDGEPHGTAGRPILASIQRAQLVDVCVVVTRIFGGVKLGPGGLIRAYGAAAQEIIEQAEIVDKVPTKLLRVRTAFAHVDVVKRACDHFTAEFILQAYAEDATFTISVPVLKSDAFVSFVQTKSSGQVEVKELQR
ncbi:ABC transporter [Phytophthora megakarya]|uniref:ABC transporter n=1 Tax=Phytophthora megakarya TaxID=4795 RepID=A0A225W3N8_9STRA|nr:ABC transporter [Phytophthora megakarya]